MEILLIGRSAWFIGEHLDRRTSIGVIDDDHFLEWTCHWLLQL